MSSSLPRRLVFVDTETTGTQFGQDRIIEVGLILVEDNQIISTYSSLVNPETYVSPFIYKLTGIDERELSSAPLFSQILPDILPFFEDSIFVAHNARFDFAFFKSEFSRLEYPFDHPQLCTVRVSRRLFPEFSHHNLDSLITRHQLPCTNRHRAFDDAMVLYHFYNLVREQKNIELTSAVASILKTPSLPPHLNATVVPNLTDSPGVYIFYDENKNPLYVGKSKHLKNRILSHFSDTIRPPRELSLSGKTTSIETIETPGELGAFLLESRLVKELLPVHNRQLRPKKQLLILKKFTTPQGYLSAQSLLLPEIDPENLSDILGIFRSKKQLAGFLTDLAKEYQLCPKLLGVDHSAYACFSYHLGDCRGACTGKEKPLKYNLRFLDAFSDHTFITWPFKGPVVITETHPLTRQRQSFLVDRWLLLATFNPDSEPDIYSSQSPPFPAFDLDIYKILKRFLLDPKNKSLIHLLPVNQKNDRPLEPES